MRPTGPKGFASSLSRVLTPLLPHRPVYNYERFWAPASEAEARRMIIEPYPSDEAFEAAGQWDAERIKRLMPHRDSVLVDFGCGIGRVIRYLTSYTRVYGLDVSEKMLEIARRRVPAANVQFRKVQGLTLPLPTASVDLVYSLLTLQHIDRRDVKRLIQEFRRVLKPSGPCYVQFPQYGDGELGRDTRPYTVGEVLDLLAGFAIESIDIETVRGGEAVPHLAMHPEASLWTNMHFVARRHP